MFSFPFQYSPPTGILHMNTKGERKDIIPVIVNCCSSDYYYFHLLKYECTISRDDIIIRHGTTRQRHETITICLRIPNERP